MHFSDILRRTIKFVANIITITLKFIESVFIWLGCIIKAIDLRKTKKFRHLFLFLAILCGAIIWIILNLLNLNMLYLLFYLYFVGITYILIEKISEINEFEKLSKWDFLKFITTYMAIIILYIVLFGFVFYFTSIIKNGYFMLNNEVYILKIWDSFFISGITFVSYDVGFFPEALMRLFVFVEVFTSQIIILAFLFIVFGKLLDKMKSKF